MLRVVHLEDDPADVALVAETLQAENIQCTIVPVSSRETFERALAQPIDLILSDYSLPGFDGGLAQEIARRRCPEVPFVFVSGSIGEEEAVERLKNGATDYVLKDHLDKLPSAVRRAIRESDDRREREAAERALRELNATLEARVAERTRALVETNEALAAARAEADRANQAKSDFLSHMSHDLRTPLNAVMGFAQLLQMDSLSSEQAESVDQIYRAGSHLLSLINEILDLARIEAGHLSLSIEPINLGRSVADAVALIHPLARQRNVSVTVDVPDGLHAQADPQRLSQILLNLLSNAVKYNRANGTVRITGCGESSARVRVDVADTGAGIPPEQLALMFKPFERLGISASTQVEGTGLGLAVSRRLAEAMDGSLTAVSAPGEGTTLSLFLPASDETAAPDRPRQIQQEAQQAAGTVLYVEDNRANVLLMRRVLQRRPAVILRHAPDGNTALTLIRAEPPDLIMLDMQLPDMPGEAILQHVRSNPETARIPVVVLTADLMGRREGTLLSAGASRCLAKRFVVSDVLHLVDEMLGAR